MKLTLYTFAAYSMAISSLFASMRGSFAQPATPKLNTPLTLSSPPLQAHYRPPQRKNLGTGRSKGGASRGDCLQSRNRLPLIALAPPDTSQTVTERPTLWFYIPYPLTAKQSVVLSIRKDDKKATPQRREVFIPEGATPGVIAVQTPIALEMRQAYWWTLTVSCEDENPTDADNAYVDGMIERTEPAAQLTAALQRHRADLRQQAVSYAQNGIWFEALNLFGELRRSRPQDPQLRNDWQQMLNKAGVGEVSDMPLRPCCTLRSK
jgi:Domain of Unknown Function (DUF928)